MRMQGSVRIAHDHWADPGGRSLDALDEFVGSAVRELVLLEDVDHFRKVTFHRIAPKPKRCRPCRWLPVAILHVIPLVLLLPATWLT